MRKLVSRKEALERGLKRYFTGKPCKHGHVCERIIRDYNCVSCANNRSKSWYYRNPERSRVNENKWRSANADRVYVSQLKYRKRHPEKIKVIQKNYRKNNLDKVRMSGKIWREKNQGTVRIHKLKWRARMYASYRLILDMGFKFSRQSGSGRGRIAKSSKRDRQRNSAKKHLERIVAAYETAKELGLLKQLEKRR